MLCDTDDDDDGAHFPEFEFLANHLDAEDFLWVENSYLPKPVLSLIPRWSECSSCINIGAQCVPPKDDNFGVGHKRLTLDATFDEFW